MAVLKCWQCRSPIFVATEFLNSLDGGRSELAVESDDLQCSKCATFSGVVGMTYGS
jgi:hypothetical protein